jgi:hypothetical protein
MVAGMGIRPVAGVHLGFVRWHTVSPAEFYSPKEMPGAGAPGMVVQSLFVVNSA